MENNRNKLPFPKTKRLDTMSKKGSELPTMRDIHVCFIGTHQNPNHDSGSSSSTSSYAATWHTLPEDPNEDDPNELARILKKYEEMMQEKEPQDSGLEFDVDKALGGLSLALEELGLEELISILDLTNEILADVDDIDKF